MQNIQETGNLSEDEDLDPIMKVAQILLSPRIGGAETLVHSLAEQWAQMNVSAVTYYLDEGDSGPRGRLGRLLRLSRQLRKDRPDVILSHSALPNIYARMAAPVGVPVVTVLHSAGDDFKGKLIGLAESLLAFRTAHVVAVSSAQRESYVGHYPNGPAVTVIPNGIRGDLPRKTACRRQLSQLGTVARVATQKNPWLWGEVVKHPGVAAAGLTFQWWGPIAAEAEIPELVDEFTRGVNARHAAFVGSTAEPGRVLETFDALFHPADREAHSIGILEAAAVGIPVICSSNVAQTLPSWLSVTEFRTGDAQDAFDAVMRLRARWPEAAHQALKEAERVRSEFSMAICAATYMAMFRRIRG